ncbi:MAG: Bug family tripartite tricarboxylate transporter substrate binding protein [Thermodesulfobacteriota bacterium]
MGKRKYSIWLLVMIISFCWVLGESNFLSAGAKIKKPANYPTRGIEVIVGWGAGGGTDTYMRAISIYARRLLGVPLTIINMPGASGAKAAEYVQQQPADGYTLWAMGSNFPINIALKKTKYQVDDFEPVIRNQWDVATIQTSEEKGRFKTIQELIAYAKKNPRQVSIGGTGAASFDEVVCGLFSEAAGIELKYIPYEKAGSMHAAVLGGHLDVMFEEPGPTIDLLEAGKLKPLVVFMEKRLDKFPNAPTAKELGYDVTMGIWRGILAKAGTPPEIIQYLHDVFKAASEHSIYRAVEKESYLHLRPGYMGGKDFKELIRKEVEIYRKVLKKLGHI